MKELEVYQKLKNSKIIKKYSNNTILLANQNFKCICKKISIPFSKKELLSQHKFIEFLSFNKINVASIIDIFYINDSTYELQEFVDGNFNISINKLIEFIAKFHQVSIKYNGNLVKKKFIKLVFNVKVLI